jgi:diguanylate cyclase (GGDEF)-like protein/PAS domain S-box-containing protein
MVLKLKTVVFLALLLMGVMPLLSLIILELPGVIDKMDEASQRGGRAEAQTDMILMNRRLSGVYQVGQLLAEDEKVQAIVSGLKPSHNLSVNRMISIWLQNDRAVNRVFLLDEQLHPRAVFLRDMNIWRPLGVGREQSNDSLTAFEFDQIDKYQTAGKLVFSQGIRDKSHAFLQVSSPVKIQEGFSGFVVLLVDLNRFFENDLHGQYPTAYLSSSDGSFFYDSQLFPNLSLKVQATVSFLINKTYKNPIELGHGKYLLWQSLSSGQGRPVLWLGRILDSSVMLSWLSSFEAKAFAVVLTLILVVFILSGLLAAWFDRGKRHMMRALDRLLKDNGKIRFDWKGPVLEVEQIADDLNLLSAHYGDLVTQREQVEQALIAEKNRAYREKERALITLQSIGDAVITTDTETRIEYLNPVAEELTEWSNEEANGLMLGEVFHVISEISREPLANPARVCLQEGCDQELVGHAILVLPNGKELAVDHVARPIRMPEGEMMGVLLVFNDVSKQRQLQKQLAYQANHDALTGLVNRRECERHIEEAIQSALKEEKLHALLFLDLDKFKIVNDTCGHAAGDELLRQISELFKRKVRDRDVLARMGGDEFSVLLNNCNSKAATQIAEGIRAAVKDYRFIWRDKVFEVGVSIGIVVINQTSRSLESVLSAADTACYAAKDGGRDCVYVYDVQNSDLAQHGETEWVTRISKSLETNDFRLYGQPIVALQDTDEKIHCYEILIRMNENGRLIPPGAFIPAAERYNLMACIDRWVLHEVVQWLASDVGSDHWCFVNLCASTLEDKHFFEYLDDQLSQYQVEPERLCFEITESIAVANLSATVCFFKGLKERGCRLALDHFGGTSSFSVLQHFSVDYIKIDSSYIRNVLTDEVDLAKVEYIHKIAHLMGKKTVAENVETLGIREKLVSMGIDMAQGYQISEPESLKCLTAVDSH